MTYKAGLLPSRCKTIMQGGKYERKHGLYFPNTSGSRCREARCALKFMMKEIMPAIQYEHGEEDYYEFH